VEMGLAVADRAGHLCSDGNGTAMPRRPTMSVKAERRATLHDDAAAWLRGMSHFIRFSRQIT
jgi:hypothetical protein